jgi:hypothetical protein
LCISFRIESHFFFCFDRQLINAPYYTGDKSFRAHIRSENVNQSYSWSTNIAVQIGDTIFELSVEDRRRTRYYLDKTEITFAQIPDRIEGYVVNKVAWNDPMGQPNHATITISMEWGDVIELKAYGTYSNIDFVRFTNRFSGSVGMLGNYANGTMTYRNGTGVPASNVDWFAFGSTWQVQPTEPQLFRTAGSQSCTRPAVGARGWFSEGTARQHCVNAGVLTANLDICQWDVYLTGDPAIANMYKPRA